MTPRTVRTSGLLRSKLPLQRHICSQLRHKHTGREDTPSSAVLKQTKKKSIPPGRIRCDPGQVLTGSTVAGIRHLTPNAGSLFLFPCLPATERCIPNTHPAAFAQHASYHVTGIYHFTSCGGGELRDRGALHHQQMLLSTGCFHKLAPLQTSGGSAY